MKPRRVKYVGLRKLEMPIVTTAILKVCVYFGEVDEMIILKLIRKIG
jgi:hypothetical protein